MMTRSYILKGLRLGKKSSYADLNKLPLSIVSHSGPNIWRKETWKRKMATL